MPAFNDKQEERLSEKAHAMFDLLGDIYRDGSHDHEETILRLITYIEEGRELTDQELFDYDLIH